MEFNHVSTINKARALEWHKGGLEEWSVADWSNAMAGEAGEVCNAVKKLRRIETVVQQVVGPQTREEAVAKIATEIGDTYLYLDLLAQRLGINIEDAIRDTFNRVSEREGFPHRL
jgi:NTP pyrophosphatase (non-canonical NTP hydrolase)